jgi:predicted transcriptional regulator
MKAVWRLKSASVHDVLQSLPKSKRPAYNTILTIMRILEQKGYLRREKAGRAHVYRSLVSRGQARTRAVQHMVHSFFEDSPEQLVLSVLESEKLSPAEIARLKEMIDRRG